MSEQKHNLNEREVVIIGEIVDIDRRTSATGRTWAIITIETQYEHKEDLIVERYPVRAFGNAMEDVGKSQIGDRVSAVCRVKSKEWNGKWYIELQIKEIEVLQMNVFADPVQAESGTGEIFVESELPDQGLPF